MLILKIFVLTILVYKIPADVVEITCPSYCKCDMFLNHKFASCVSRNLATIEADIPVQAELLDISYNHISELRDHIFSDLGLTSLKLLNMSHNKLNSIHMNAFYDLNLLKTIDLSYNSIQYLLVNWFWNLPILEELYLSGNNLMHIPNGPLLESKSLQQLDLSKCQLLYIYEDTFSKLPNLEILDISNNFLIEINKNVLKPLQNLHVVNFNDNKWTCNNVMEELDQFCKIKGIHFNEQCVKSSPLTHEKFQKMIKLENSITEKNSWIFNVQESSTNKNSIRELCSNSSTTEKDIILEIIQLSPILSIIIVLIFGITVGVIIGCSVQMKPPKKTWNRPVGRTCSIIRNRRRQLGDNFEHPLIQSDSYEVNSSSPIPDRKNSAPNASLDSFI